MDDEDFLDGINEAEDEEPVKVEIVKADTPVEAETPASLPELLLDNPVEPKPDDVAEGRLSALLDEREKRKAAEARLAQLEAQNAQRQPVQLPDMFEDPEGYAAAQDRIVNARLYQMNLRYSERLARSEHGAEKVDAAKAWAIAKCDADPLFNAKIAQSDDPVGLAVSEYQREAIVSQVTPDEFAQFQAWKAAQNQISGAPPAPPNPASSIPKRSLASATSAGTMLSEAVQSDDEIFDEVIPKR